AAADEGDFSPNAEGDVDDLLNAVNRGGEAGQNHATRRGAAELFDAGHDGAFRRGEARAFDVGGITEEREHSFVAVTREGVQVERSTVDGCLVDFEITGMDDNAKRRSHSQCDTIDRAMSYGNEFDLEGPDFNETAGQNFAQCG